LLLLEDFSGAIVAKPRIWRRGLSAVLRLNSLSGAVFDVGEIFCRFGFSKDKQMLVHYQVELIAFGFGSPAFGRSTVVLNLDDVFF